MKVKTRLISLALVLIMVLGVVPVTALAADDLFTIAGANMTLGNELALNFMVNASDIDKNESYTAAIVHGSETAVVSLRKYNDAYYCASYSVAAKEMTDEVSVVIVDGAGKPVSKSYSRTIADYAQSLLNSSDKELQTVVVDMLNYGTEAQKYFGYNENAYANENLTEEQAAFATSEVAYANHQVIGNNLLGSSLSLEDRILLNIMFKAESKDGMTAQISFEDYRGETVTAAAKVETFGKNAVKVCVDEIVLADARQLVNVKVFDAEGELYGEASDSVESYVARTIASETGALNEAIMKFADSAKAYLTEDTEEETPDVGGSGSGDIVVDENSVVKETVSLESGNAQATVPEGVVVNNASLVLSVTEMDESEADVTVGENETALSLNVHVDGVSPENTTAILVNLGDILPKALNMGNIALYHVENGETVAMTRVLSLSELDAHNEYYYDPITGEVTVALASFSEVTAVSEEPKWEGDRDYKWYDADAEVLEIANADQLAAFGAIVGGMDGQTQDSFAGKTVKLVNDINIGDLVDSDEDELVFYPIGYNSSDGKYEKTGVAVTTGFYNFAGTFDGNGHTISNFYQNTWEMKGDHDWYSPQEQYYRDGMGLFGRVYGGTVKNLTVKNFSSDGEIATTGVIAAYADGATFENIAIFGCNPRVYNIGNGGIVGCVGWYAKEAGLKTTFKNITVDNSNKISALWGSYDVACGGIVGQYYPTSGQSSENYPVNAGIEFTNCHVAAQMDVYNDVCANYQYYAYRYTGMLIGSVRENVTIDGHSYPKMDGITASGCTVHFGTWNDYYYCEIIDNTTASYTHDYQMSRLTEIKAIDGTTITYLDDTTGTVPASGRANYVIVDYTKGHGTENATCYHFKDGAVWTHDMGGIQTGIDENGDGQDDLKEDKQHIYLEFNNLVTGYGWGVTTKAVGDLEGVTILDREEGTSVKKFEKADTAKDSYTTETTVTIGDLFKATEAGLAEKTKIQSASVQVAVSAVGETSTVTGTYVADTTDWTQGTLTFSGTGAATVTITDYYFCTPTTITVTITEKVSVEKFETKFTNSDKYMYRVGNQNAVKLDSLFKAKTGAKIGNVSVTVEPVDNTGASGTYTANATWTNGTIQFSGTGVVKVTITDNDYCTPTELILEVVDATNLTSATGTTTGGNFVLVKDVNTSTYVNYWNCTLYGNGFTYSLKGAPTDYNSKNGHGIIIAQNATLDNVVIVGDVYSTYGAYSNMSYYNSAVDAMNTVIQNCHISNCSTPLRARGNNTVIDTTLYGGTVGNMVIQAGTNTLTNVTTVNYSDDREIVGYGIVIHPDATEDAKLVLNGTFKQYNFLSMDDKDKLASGGAVNGVNVADKLFDAMFSSVPEEYYFVENSTKYVNTGILSMTENFTGDDIKDNTSNDYKGTPVTIDLGVGDKSGYLYSLLAKDENVDNNYVKLTDPNNATVQGDYLPTPVFNLGNQAVAGEDRYLKGDINGVEARYLQGEDAFALNINELMQVYKYDDLYYNVSTSCKDSDGNIVAVTDGIITLSAEGAYTLIFEVEDNCFYKPDGTKLDKSVKRTYEVPLTVIIAEPKIKDAVITVNKTALDGGYNESIGDRSYKFNPLNAITITDAEGTVNLTTNIASTNIEYASSSSAFAGATTITVTYNDGRVLTIKLGKPSLNSPGSSKAITYANDGTIKSAAKVASKSATGGTWTITEYSFKGKNGKTVTNNTVVTFTFPDKSCVTGDTLVALADGTQKRIDEVAYEDQLLVWNFFTGDYEAVPASIIFYHGDDLFDVLSLHFEDGTTVKTINVHGFFDIGANEFVFIEEGNVEEYIGHDFVKLDGDSYTTVKLIGYNVTEEYTGCYSIQSAFYNNFITEGMFSITIPAIDGWFDYFEIGDNMKYDEEKMAADIETYGLYTYEEFADYVTYEQFIAFNGPYLKVLVGRGVVTFEQILDLIATYVN